MRKKSALCEKFSDVFAVLATLFLGIGISMMDCYDLTLPITLICIGSSMAALTFIFKKLSYYYKRRAKQEKNDMIIYEIRRRESFDGDYTKISA